MQLEWQGINTQSLFTLSLVYLPPSDATVLSSSCRVRDPEGATLVIAEVLSCILKFCDCRAPWAHVCTWWTSLLPGVHHLSLSAASLPSVSPSPQRQSTLNKLRLPGKTEREVVFQHPSRPCGHPEDRKHSGPHYLSQKRKRPLFLWTFLFVFN